MPPTISKMESMSKTVLKNDAIRKHRSSIQAFSIKPFAMHLFVINALC